MKAVVLSGFGDVDVMSIGEVATPKPGQGQLLVRVRATALNRADLLQRRGFYPPPKGESEILGLEMAGDVVEVGEGVEGWKAGDRVCALLPGGGYAEYAVIPEAIAMRLPENLSYEQAAAIPEVFLTAYLNLFQLGGLVPGMTVLVHAGASGVGTAAIQLIREGRGKSIVTAGSDGKIARCLELGATAGFDYHQGSFRDFVMNETDGEGVHIILDFIGAPYYEDNIRSLAMDGRLVIIGTMGGSEVPKVNLGYLLGRRLQVIGTALRSRTADFKAQLTQDFWNFAEARFVDGRLQPIVDSVFDWSEVQKAHAYMESNQNVGKIILRVGE